MVLRKHGGTASGQVLVGSLKHFEVDCQADITSKFGIQSGRVTGITVTTDGAGYTIGAVTVNISAPDLPDGVQATATAESATAGTYDKDITVIEEGSGYLTAPTVTLTQADSVAAPTTTAVATATIADAGESSTVLRIVELIATKSTVVILGETGTNGAGTCKFRFAVESSTPWVASSTDDDDDTTLTKQIQGLGTVDGVNLSTATVVTYNY